MRTNKTIRPAVIAIAGAVVVLVLAHTGHGIPCVFRVLTGWKCPGCGITTMILEMLRGNVSAAFAANPFLFVTLPLLLADLFVVFFLSVSGAAKTLSHKLFPAVYLAALLLFGVFRNIAA